MRDYSLYCVLLDIHNNLIWRRYPGDSGIQFWPWGTSVLYLGYEIDFHPLGRLKPVRNWSIQLHTVRPLLCSFDTVGLHLHYEFVGAQF